MSEFEMQSPSIRLATWNIARGLSDYQRHELIESGLETLNADVVILSESLDKTGKFANPQYAKELGYSALTVPYNDKEDHPSEQQYITMLSRLTLDATEVRLGTRNAITASLPSGIALYGAHFDDREESKRLVIAEAFTEMAADEPKVVLAGDLNSMHREDAVAKKLRTKSVRGLAAIAPHPRIRSLGKRLTEMADGSTLNLLESAGFVDVDPEHQPTMRKTGIAVALDHILVKGDISSEHFMNTYLQGSDHRAISVSLS